MLVTVIPSVVPSALMWSASALWSVFGIASGSFRFCPLVAWFPKQTRILEAGRGLFE
jgi:hypothetical protein